jgi:hypothetical protein
LTIQIKPIALLWLYSTPCNKLVSMKSPQVISFYSFQLPSWHRLGSIQYHPNRLNNPLQNKIWGDERWSCKWESASSGDTQIIVLSFHTQLRYYFNNPSYTFLQWYNSTCFAWDLCILSGIGQEDVDNRSLNPVMDIILPYVQHSKLDTHLTT